MNIEENILSHLRTFYSDNDSIQSLDSQDFESEMAQSQLKSIIKNSYNLYKMIEGKENLPSWVQSKLTKSSDYLTSVHDYLDGRNKINESKRRRLREESSIKKNTWTTFTKSDVDELQQQIFDLVDNAYREIGGNPNAKTPADVKAKLGDNFYVIDLDDDPEIDAVDISKSKKAGEKMVAIGHDGTKPAKSSVIKHKIDKLNTKGHYVEVSGKMYDILKAKGVQIINDEDTVRKVVAKPDIEWNGDGTYSRVIAGKRMTKVLMGKPN